MTFVFVIDYQIKRMEQINTNARCEQLRKSYLCNTNIGSMLGKHNLTNENYFDKTYITNYLSGQERKSISCF